MENSSSYAELTHEELEVIQELEQALSHIKGRYIALIAYDLGEDGDADTESMPYAEEEFDVSATPAP